MSENVVQGSLTPDPAGADVSAIGGLQVDALELLLAQSGLSNVSLAGRYSVLFFYPGIGAGRLFPELAGCTAEVCTFADQTLEFARHGIQLLGLTTQQGNEADTIAPLPFPVARLNENAAGDVVEIIHREGRGYAPRTTFLLYPDGTGVRIRGITDSVAHVRKCFDMVLEKRLAVYHSAILAGIQRDTSGAHSTLQLCDFLPNGAASVSIARLELKTDVVCKMADPHIVAEEAGYIDRINRLMIEHGHAALFPAVLAAVTDEQPGWYLMQSADPAPLADHLFADDAHTVLRRDRLHILLKAVSKLATLYNITFRREIPEVSRYHYLERFLAIPVSHAFRETFNFLFSDSTELEKMLRTTFVLEDGFVCRPYHDQVQFLGEHIDELLQPVGVYLHGDVHLPNMLLARNGSDVVFIDPRIVWDGKDFGDPGFGDPMYDYATLLHSLHYMSAVLKAVDRGHTERLLHIEDAAAAVRRVAPGMCRLRDDRTVRWFVDWMEKTLPASIRGSNWKARLHVGAANATIGWLKHARSIQTRHAWRTVFVAALYHLELGRRLLEAQHAALTSSPETLPTTV